jgi:hypothetical protein
LTISSGRHSPATTVTWVTSGVTPQHRPPAPLRVRGTWARVTNGQLRHPTRMSQQTTGLRLQRGRRARAEPHRRRVQRLRRRRRGLGLGLGVVALLLALRLRLALRRGRGRGRGEGLQVDRPRGQLVVLRARHPQVRYASFSHIVA